MTSSVLAGISIVREQLQKHDLIELPLLLVPLDSPLIVGVGQWKPRRLDLVRLPVDQSDRVPTLDLVVVPPPGDDGVRGELGAVHLEGFSAPVGATAGVAAAVLAG